MRRKLSIYLLFAVVSMTGSLSGQVISTVDIPFTPFDLAFDPEGNLLFVPDEPGDGQCLVFSQDLGFVSQFTMPFGAEANIRGIAVEPDGDLIWAVTIAGQPNIFETAADGTNPILRGVLPVIAGNSVLGIDLDSDGVTLFINVIDSAGVATVSIPMASLGALGTATICPVTTLGDVRFGVAWRQDATVLTLGIDPQGFFNEIEVLDLNGCVIGTLRILPIDFSLGFDVGTDDPNGLSLYVSDMEASTVNLVRIERTFIRGDATGDLVVDQGDLNSLGQFLAGGPPPPCMAGADFNDNGFLELGDLIGFSFFLNGGGAPPLPPFPNCGVDPTPDNLTCAVSGCP